MTSEQLQAIRERCEKATPGPWEWDERAEKIYSPQYWVVKVDEGVTDEDAEFIAHARTDIPALLDEIERLRNMVSESVQVIEELAEDIIRTYPERADVQTSDVLPSLFTASEFRRKVCQALEGSQ